jgi:hypothetical protein
MYSKDKEIRRLNSLTARSVRSTVRNSLIIDDLEAISVADFLRQLSLDDEARRRTEDEELQKRNDDVLEAIGKAINATKARAEEKKRREEDEKRRREKLELERRMVWCQILLTMSNRSK